MYTHRNQKERHYYCKKNNTRYRNRGQGCVNPYIQAKKIEPKIDELLSVRLQTRELLESIAEMYLLNSTSSPPSAAAEVDREQVERELGTLRAKRQRILETFFDGLINRTERDQRLANIESEIASFESLKADHPVTQQSAVSLETLVELLSVFTEWPSLGRDDKRSILHSLGAEIHVEGYAIRCFALARPLPNTNNGDHLKMAT
jgi:hypothetical protein